MRLADGRVGIDESSAGRAPVRFVKGNVRSTAETCAYLRRLKCVAFGGQLEISHKRGRRVVICIQDLAHYDVCPVQPAVVDV